MGNNVKQEMSKIPIPKELHKRSQLGIQKAKEEIGDIKKEYKNKKKILLVASILLPFLISGSVIIYHKGIPSHSNETKLAAYPPIERSASLPAFDKAQLKKYDRKNPAITDSTSDYMRNATIIFTGKVTEKTPFQVQGETLTKIRVDVEEIYRGSTKKGERVTFVEVGQNLGNPVIIPGEKYLFFGLKASDEKEVDDAYYRPLKVFQGQEAQKVLEQVNK